MSALPSRLVCNNESVTVMGIGVSYHRLVTHGAFRTGPAFRFALVCGPMAAQGPTAVGVARVER
jgi:fatty-acid desaturase